MNTYSYIHYEKIIKILKRFTITLLFLMGFWGFVDPESLDKKEGLGADALAELAGVDEHDEFFKDNAIEVIKDHQ